jgi:ribosomal protein L40E
MNTVVVCERCGTENPSSATVCAKCHGSLGRTKARPSSAAPSSSAPSRAVRKSSIVGILAAMIGFVMLAYVVFDLITTEARVRDLRDSLSAVQVTQLYTQSSFWLLVAIGVLLAGILFVVSTR